MGAPGRVGAGPPWEAPSPSVRLDFGEPSHASEYLNRLFTAAFRIADHLVDLPGQYETRPALAVRAELQAGLLLTFLQHGRVRDLASQANTMEYDGQGDGRTLLRTGDRGGSWYKHQKGGAE